MFYLCFLQAPLPPPKRAPDAVAIDSTTRDQVSASVWVLLQNKSDALIMCNFFYPSAAEITIKFYAKCEGTADQRAAFSKKER